jgi:hypothetical protein
MTLCDLGICVLAVCLIGLFCLLLSLAVSAI